MAKCKAGDEQGIVVEMLQKGGDHLMQVLVELFNDILDPASMPPEQWRLAKLIVLFKKGDAADPSNYRSIAILPILYKVFSKIICNRLRIMFDNAQTADQAGFRSGYSCDDHLLTSVVIVEKAYEFNMSLWAATVDFQKAFDTVEHDSIWKAMRDIGIPEAYIRVFSWLYREQFGIVRGAVSSRKFAIQRGTKQGDPMSSNIFNAVLEMAMKDVQDKWRKKGWGIDVGYGRTASLCNLRFADDVLLLANTRN
jgi:hypothetical protein